MYATRALRMMPTRRMMRPVPKEDQSAHTVSQRLRKIKDIPAELWPLAAVVGFALFAAGYSTFRKFTVDKNLRLARQNRKDEPAAHDDH
ncbi:Uu.00g066290.m01.CDS01 [Anthostomella pinea]|uniref:Uu.00g066290.m01.CDS01 n=1 Tax=Anthostomella pinea TaxID=933095 RepID=A0AAI8VTY7_9PEZI|nr:Uu.00g066290.m01.CDS01 [Anthostomella pinea]